MAVGPGKYDDEVTNIMERTNANAVIVVVFDGNKGSGFSCQVINDYNEFHKQLPKMLRDIANQIEKSIIN